MYNPNLMKAIVTISYRFYSDFLELHQQLICSTLFPTISNTSCIFYQAIDADHKTVFKNSLSSLCENNKSIFLLCHNLGSENNYSFFLNFPLMPADQAMRTNGVKKLQTEEGGCSHTPHQAFSTFVFVFPKQNTYYNQKQLGTSYFYLKGVIGQPRRCHFQDIASLAIRLWNSNLLAISLRGFDSWNIPS